MSLKVKVISRIVEGQNKWANLPAVTNILERYANKIRNQTLVNIKSQNLIDTGNMLNSIQIDRPNSYTREIGNTPAGYYAIFHELGTKHIKAKPFLGPAADQYRNEFTKEILNAI